MMKNNKYLYIMKTLDTYFPNPKCPLNYKKDYELLIAVVLSAQSTDERVNMVTKELFKYNLKELSLLNLEDIERIIKPVGMYKKKSQYIHDITNILINNKGIVPNDRVFIESLPGVGHKTCNVVISELFLVPSFAVDTHVARVSKRLGITLENSSIREIENDLMNAFPKESWRKLHIQFVLFGRNICKAIKPKCITCPFKSSICKRPQD